MALINCPECNKEISDTAEKCPNCGYNVKKHLNQEKKQEKVGKYKNKIVIAVIVIIAIVLGLFFVPSKPKSFEEQIYAYMEEIQEEYGKVSLDLVYAYCDGIEQTILIHYYGIGKYNEDMDDTFVYYKIDKKGKVEIKDPNGDVDSLSSDFFRIVRSGIWDNYEKYADSNQYITYEEFNQFKEGCLKETYFSEINDKLRESYQE